MHLFHRRNFSVPNMSVLCRIQLVFATLQNMRQSLDIVHLPTVQCLKRERLGFDASLSTQNCVHLHHDSQHTHHPSATREVQAT